MSKWVIRDAESGVIYDMFGTEDEAKSAVKEYETADKADGYYKPGQYEISEE